MRIARRLFMYVLGLFFLALGVAFSISSDLGVSPVNSLPYATSLVSGLPMSVCVPTIFGVYILLQIIILRRDYKWKNLLQLPFSFLFGYLTDFTKYIFRFLVAGNYVIQLAFLVVSICCVGLGLVFYLSANLVPMPMEGLTLAISAKFPKIKFHNLKISADCASVLLAVVITFVFSGHSQGVREGTVLTAIAVGKVMAVIDKMIGKYTRSFCMSEDVKDRSVKNIKVNSIE